MRASKITPQMEDRHLYQIFNTKKKKKWTFAHLTWPGFLFMVVAVCSTVLAFFFSFFFSLSAKVPRILDIISESVFAYWIRCFNYLKTSYFSSCWRLFLHLSLIFQISLCKYELILNTYLRKSINYTEHQMKISCDPWFTTGTKLDSTVFIIRKNHRFSYEKNRTEISAPLLLSI